MPVPPRVSANSAHTKARLFNAKTEQAALDHTNPSTNTGVRQRIPVISRLPLPSLANIFAYSVFRWPISQPSATRWKILLRNGPKEKRNKNKTEQET